MTIAKSTILRFVLAVLGLPVGQKVAAQGATIDSVALRRTAVYSALANRAGREGTAIKVGLCSVVRAIEYSSEVRSMAPVSVEGSLIGDGSPSCPPRGGAQMGSSWVIVGEVLSAIVAGPSGGGLSSVTVSLRVWEGPGTYVDEVYDFNPSGAAQWSPVAYHWLGRSYINLVIPRDAYPFVLVNGQVVSTRAYAEILNHIRGQVIDSIRVFAANDSGYTARYGSAAARGGVIVGTHLPRRRP